MVCLCLVASHVAGVASGSLPEIDDVIFMILDGIGATSGAATGSSRRWISSSSSAASEATPGLPDQGTDSH